MPTYEYVCTECQTRMEIRATIAEKEKGLTVICPKCWSKKTAQVFSGFMMMGATKGNGSAPNCGPGCSCCG